MTRKPKRTLSSAISGTAHRSPAPASPSPPQRDHEAALPREHVEKEDPVPPHGFKTRKSRIEKPHQSVYAHPDVFRELRKIAAAEDKKPQELYREGLREVFRRRGLDFDALDRDVEE